MTHHDHPYDQTVTVRATPEAVFRALTSAEVLQRWFPTRAQTDPRPGGEFQYGWDFADAAQNGTQKGHYVDCVPGSKVSYTWEAGQNPARQTTVTFTIKPDGDQTTVSLAHTDFGPGPEGEKLRDYHAGPWTFYMSNLKTYLESGVDNRAAALGQKTA
jgi:uncharacterized protein YndB with AHSA1/START domain